MKSYIYQTENIFKEYCTEKCNTNSVKLNIIHIPLRYMYKTSCPYD
jgi:hypothetical protein